MKNIFLLILTIVFSNLFSQNELFGLYKSSNGHVFTKLELLPNNLCKFSKTTDIAKLNYNGNWKLKGDSILIFLNNDKNDTITLTKTDNENLFYYSFSYKLVNEKGFSKPNEYYLFKELGYNIKGDIIEQYERLNYNSSSENGGKYHGIIVIKDKNCKIIKISNYSNGQLNGQQMEFYKNGIIKSVKKWKDGKPYDNWLFYDEKGRLIEIKEFKRGKLIKNKT